MKKILIPYAVLTVTLVAVFGVTFAAFTDKTKVLGSTFSVGSADIKLLKDLDGGVEEENLVDELLGPEFLNIDSNWTSDYLVKIFNNTQRDIVLTTNADYLTEQDPEDLRQLIYVEPIEWLDTNNNGILNDGELGLSYGRDTIVKWKTQGFDLGQFSASQIKGIVFRFSTQSVPDSKQGASGIFTFELNSLGL